MTIAEFERRILIQVPTAATHYDAEYFTGEWRDAGNNYSLDTRRSVEGRNPSLIKEILEPMRALDLGCGPGALMHLLWELDVDVEGIDFAESSRRLASPEVRDRIAIGSVTDASLKSDNCVDVVICREVIEHLTVLEVRRAVANMVRMTSRLVYVTTRYHQAPEDLLDFNQSDNLDPTHITLLNKDLLRLMFVLEGCRSRPDLEARMDWGHKGRVLVMEKIPAA
jgi:2-polyprenyl-3-methyl-5-hydroxy-6-metoxy-1,4-benzoquinol methylase